MNQNIEDRIWNAIPVTQQAFFKLLELLDIEESQTIPTACVTLGNRSRLLVNPAFIAKHCHTNDRLAMLVMHELFHILLGHTRLFERVTQAHNWAFDAVINAHLCRLFPEQSYTILFRELYKPDVFPEALLRPPEGWATNTVNWQLNGDALRVHETLYSDDSATYHELFLLLKDAFDENLDESRQPVLLGNHEGPFEGTEPSPELAEEVRNIVARWPMVERVSGRDQGQRSNRFNITPPDPKKHVVSTIRRALIGLLDQVCGFGGVPLFGETTVSAVLPYMSEVDRHAAVRDAIGETNLFYKATLVDRGFTHFEKVHVYVDVSGSMDGVLPHIYAALLPLRSYLSERIHLFSTEIADITPRQLSRGDIDTTCGTEIQCVTEHIIKNRVCTALIITDGWVGTIPENDLGKFNKRKVRINTVMTHFGDDVFAKPLNGKIFQLNELY